MKSQEKKMYNTKSLLKEFMYAFGPSGHEKEVAALFKNKMCDYADEINVDRAGNVICRFDGIDPDAPKIMVFAHLDQIGLIVRKVEPNGLLKMDRIGYIPEKILPGLKIQLQTENGSYIYGVFGNKSQHAASVAEQNYADKLSTIFLDIGATTAQEVYELGINVGSPAIYAPDHIELANSFISGTAVDNRGGLVALIQIAQELKKQPHDCTVYLVGTVWEEFNVRGAAFATRAISPDIIISLDVALGGDTPDMADRNNTKCGNGPVISYLTFHGRGSLNGTIAHAGLSKLAVDTAIAEKIPFQRFASTDMLTDASFAQMEGNAPATLELGYTTRYTHTPTEMTDIRDIEHLSLLVTKLLQRISKDFNLNRYTI